MAFYIDISDSEGNSINEVGFSHGVLAYWEGKGKEYNLPIISGMYEEAFSEGFSSYEQKLLDLKIEAEKLQEILGKEGHERTTEITNNMNATSNLVALDKFILILKQAIDLDGDIYIS